MVTCVPELLLYKTMSEKDDNTLYVVGGYMRCGTSMMMQALSAGGLTPDFDERRDEFRKEHADDHYDPNEGGLYELHRSAYNKPNFPRDHKGKLIKCLRQGPKDFRVMRHGVRAVIMRRSLSEIKRSYRAFFGKELQEWNNNTNFQLFMERIIRRIQNRKDFLSVDTYWYSDVVYRREPVFEELAESGWPIDPVRSWSIIDPGKARHTNKDKVG